MPYLYKKNERATVIINIIYIKPEKNKNVNRKKRKNKKKQIKICSAKKENKWQLFTSENIVHFALNSVAP